MSDEKSGDAIGHGELREERGDDKKLVGQYDNVAYDEKEEQRVVRKIDLVVMPTISILYLLSFLDRSNVGNAKIEGMLTDLGIPNDQYSTILTLYFVGYVIAEVPANWALKLTSPPFWLPTITLTWGIVSVCMGLVHNKAGMFAVRFFLGVAEAGLFPGTVFIFSRFYKRNERPARVAFFFSAAAASGAFGGILAYALAKMDGVGGKRGYQWIFIIEGLLTVVCSCIAYFVVPTYPQQSNFFTEREKQVIVARLQTDSDAMDDEPFRWSEVKRAATSAQVYGYCFLFHGFSFGLYTLSNFLPSIILGLGYKSWQAQLLTVPPYVFAFLLTMTGAILTQRCRIRAPFIIGFASLAIVGYIVLLTSPTVGGKYVAVFLCAGGIYSGNAILLAWPSENLMGHTFRVTALAMQIAIGNCGAIIGTQLYRIPLGGLANKDYRISYGLTIVWLGFGIASAGALWYGLSQANKKTLQGDQTAGSTASSQRSFMAEGRGLWKRSFLYQV